MSLINIGARIGLRRVVFPLGGTSKYFKYTQAAALTIVGAGSRVTNIGANVGQTYTIGYQDLASTTYPPATAGG